MDTSQYSSAQILAMVADVSIDTAKEALIKGRSLTKAVKHLDKGAASRVELAKELATRMIKESLHRGDVLNDPDVVKTYLTAKLRDVRSEVFACIFLDNRHRVISYEEMFYGTIDGASVHPREVVRRALENNAAAVMFAHNHPSGVAEPSQADERITQKLKDALHLIDVRVLDHFVVGDTIVSFAERGLL